MEFERLSGALCRFEREMPEREALRHGDSTWSWSQLAARVRRAAGAQLEAGLRPGDRVAFLDKNHPACMETTLACSLIGTANAVVNFRLAAEEVLYVLHDSQARLLFVGAEFLPLVEEIRPKLDAVERVVVVGGDRDEYESWLERDDPGWPKQDSAADDCALQLYTSGTTGYPKGVMMTHRSLAAHARAATPGLGYSADSVNLVAMPLFHVSGSGGALVGMEVGARTILEREVNPAALLEVIDRLRVTHALFVPALFAPLIDIAAATGFDGSSLQCMGYGGSPMPIPLLERTLAAFPVDFYQAYGMTELSGIVSLLGPEEHRDTTRPERRLSAGRPLPGVEARIVDPGTLDELPPGAVGELWVRSEQAMAGYWGKPDATAETLRPDGWLRTGDAGSIDADGYIYLQDRIKDMVISGGENIYPAEVERVVAGHLAVAEVAVIGVPDDRWGEAVKAVVVPRPGAAVDEDELIAYCRERLAGYKTPRSVDVVPALPRNPLGKVLKRELRAPYWTGRSRQV